MAMKIDPAHTETESILERLELRIGNEYAKAEIEITEKLRDYMRRFQIKDDLKKKAVDNGMITEAEYRQWRVGQIAVGKRWGEMRDTIAQDLTNTAKIAKSISYGYMPDVYAVNHNYGTFQVEQLSGMNTSYTLYDRQTAEHILGLKEDERLYHKAGIKVTRAINEGKQLAWDKKQVQSVMVQSLLQGESIGNIATRLAEKVGDSDRKASIRNARTMATGVQNAGRVDSYKRAESMGIELMQEWVATLDGRTRHEHRVLDGQRVKVGEKFRVEGYEIAYPADPTADAEMVYNCRCTLIPAIKGFEADTTAVRQLDPELQEKTYEEWKKSKDIHSDPITKQDDIAAIMQGMYNAEYARYANSSDLITGDEDGTIRPMDNERNLANGARRSKYYVLNEEEIQSIKKDADDIQIPLDILRFNEGVQTGFSDRLGVINIRGNILPDTSSSNLRDRLSVKCVLAHEYYGHYKHHPSAYRIGDWRDEFRASYSAAIDSPNLTKEERRNLMLDAYDRAKEAGVSVKYNSIARRYIYGDDE